LLNKSAASLLFQNLLLFRKLQIGFYSNQHHCHIVLFCSMLWSSAKLANMKPFWLMRIWYKMWDEHEILLFFCKFGQKNCTMNSSIPVCFHLSALSVIVIKPVSWITMTSPPLLTWQDGVETVLRISCYIVSSFRIHNNGWEASPECCERSTYEQWRIQQQCSHSNCWAYKLILSICDNHWGVPDPKIWGVCSPEFTMH